MPSFFASFFGNRAAHTPAPAAAAEPATPPSAEPPAPEGEVAPAADTSASRARPGAQRGGRLPIFTDYTVPIFGQPDAERSYYHGHIDGAFEGDADTFLNFLAASNGEVEARETLDRALAACSETRSDLAASQEAHATVAAADSTLALYREEESKAQERHESLCDARDSVEAQWKETRHRGSRLSAALYGLAGILFLLGDFVVSKQVVSQALRLPLEYERVLFAAGIAALAFLVKIAYERLVERPFMDGHDRVFRWVILTSAGLTLITLAALGVLRAQVIAEGQATEQGVAAGPASFDLDASDAAPSTAAGAGINFWQVFAFVATSILFAVAGAICFGVALAMLHDYLTLRRPLDQQRGRLRRDADEAQRAYADSSARRANFEREHAQRASHLGGVEKPAALRQKLEALEATLPALYAACHALHQQALEHAYRSGYALARHNLASVPLGMSMDEYYSDKRPGGDGAGGDGLPRSRPHGARRDTGARHGVRRPFLDLRDDILDASR